MEAQHSFEWTQGIEGCMSPEQLAAHEFLLASQDFIKCPRGAMMKLSACQVRQRTHNHYQHDSRVWTKDEEPTALRFIACSGLECEHYDPHRKRIINTGKTERFFEERKARCETKDQKLREEQSAKERRVTEHTERVQAQIQARLAKRKAEREGRTAQIAPMIEEAKGMHRHGKSFAMIAKHFSVGRTTVSRWFAGPEKVAEWRASEGRS